MQQTFLQKVIFTIAIGFLVAGFIHLSNSFFDEVNSSVANPPKPSSSLSR